MCEPPALRSLAELQARVAQLRQECPWTAKQTPQSVLAFIRAEAAELEAALDDGDQAAIVSEIGDLVFNLLLTIELVSRDHAEGATEDGQSTGIELETAAAASVAKLRRRYPALFDGTLRGLSLEEANRAWLSGKASEAAGPIEGAVVPYFAEEVVEEEWDEELAAEIEELDRREAEAKEMEDRQELARLVMEEIAREQGDVS